MVEILFTVGVGHVGFGHPAFDRTPKLFALRWKISDCIFCCSFLYHLTQCSFVNVTTFMSIIFGHPRMRPLGPFVRLLVVGVLTTSSYNLRNVTCVTRIQYS